MTNEQTYIFVKALRQSLARAIEAATEAAPAEALTKSVRHIRGSLEIVFPGICAKPFCNENSNPAHWKECEVALWLTPIEEFLETLDDYLERLSAASPVHESTT